ncbi:M28 family peptidase [Lacinutrix sp. 5H-3-7-4]|uniref:M28 family peptidase n=1 Tax=Lacinutrix sp. (strain 5H-3-7-4) TaxID=983544 RepID=UPI00020A3AA8|nr:M28 family peptidase [Lacinutrix sp. 5H-3-7-4]AEH02036.1 peptidase M28 [Lacinutrix sp. 5H-3-7-4]
MKSFFILSILAVVGSCAETKYSTKIENLNNSVIVTDSTLIVKYSKTITEKELEQNLYKFSSKAFQGRGISTPGQKKASHFLKDFYIQNNIDVSFQTVPANFLPEKITTDSENVIAFIKGEEKPDEVIIVSGHLDHLGIENEEIYFGADDNGSGSMAILEIAQAFKMAENDGYRPKRSILFLHLTAEEIGLQGSLYYTQNPKFELSKTIANLNIDMIGRVDKHHNNNPNYIYVIGADRISKELNFINEKTNNAFTNLELDYKYNAENDRNRYYFRSDHYNFAKHNIPVIFYFNGTHDDYHKPTDTPEKINYPLLAKRSKLIFATAWQLANRDKMLLHNTAL